MKKIFFVMTAILSLFLVACSQSQNTEEKVYDTDFMTSLAKGLEKRWEFVDSFDGIESSKNIKKPIQLELDEVESYIDKKFEDSKLQELAISYINELNNGLNIADTYGSTDFYQNYSSHYDNRNHLLQLINSIVDIPVKNTEQLKELLAQGKTVAETSEKEKALRNLISNIEFSIDENKTNQFTTYYSAVVENTTNYTINNLQLSINLLDADEVTVDTTYAYAKNWKSGTKTKLEFMVFDEQISGYEVTLDYFDVE